MSHVPALAIPKSQDKTRTLVEETLAVDVDNLEVLCQPRISGLRSDIVLMPHQIRGFTWMKDRECEKRAGGILADEMGLGKTLQAIARILDGRPKAADMKAGWARASLIICPVALISQWSQEIRRISVGLKVIEYHGTSRISDPQKLSEVDVVITTYAIVASEFSSVTEVNHSDQPYDSKPLDKIALFGVRWWRLILDEAHNIKNRGTKAAGGSYKLKAKYRWCLTGTPMQNDVDELFSLIHFLRIKPLNDWETFKDKISKPLKAGKSEEPMKRLKLVLGIIMLRRRKGVTNPGLPLLELPPRRCYTLHCDFNHDEREFYVSLERKFGNSLDPLAGNFARKDYSYIMVMLLRLRQACDHPNLAKYDDKIDDASTSSTDHDSEPDELLQKFSELKCDVDALMRACGLNNLTSCPGCNNTYRRKILACRINDATGVILASAKVNKVIDLLREIETRSQGKEKTVIFSVFTSMLDILEWFLTFEDIKCVRFDGSMTRRDREVSLNQIKNNEAVRCMLTSIKCGGTGLNLTACNNVILIEPWWNPALEAQAFGRVHRIGQSQEVNIYKLTVPATIEERILKLQEKKRSLASAALDGCRYDPEELQLDDLMELFQVSHQS
ncbi:SNF2 family N-terminal domain-containing protein [Hygrophoropsis aurantiaca]|uniref:SNF2 family N-terminal domain-containing protein n=1 Tax=Hygrophoropsis aurantiaca TaxID=72124 RepID=A0ACB8A767_9AGAM|nr:SNF2 family N-terminal domain-containing protein [Hygrophoropsis aurantiaca]